MIQVIPLLIVKFTLIPDKGFQNTEILYQTVIAQSVEPRHIFSISINERFKRGRVRIPHAYFFHEGDIFKYHYCLRNLFNVFLLYFKCFYYSRFDNYLLHLRYHCDVSIPVLPLYFLHVSAAGNPVILGNCCNGIMSQLFNIRHLKTYISSGDAW